MLKGMPTLSGIKGEVPILPFIDGMRQLPLPPVGLRELPHRFRHDHPTLFSSFNSYMACYTAVLFLAG